jgi:hypothetical protein
MLTAALKFPAPTAMAAAISASMSNPGPWGERAAAGRQTGYLEAAQGS